jgi:hypothetical protein
MNGQFKEGEFIRNIKTNEIGQVQKYGEEKYGEESNYPQGCYFVYSFGNKIFNPKDCELWNPKQGEYICCPNGRKAFQVAQFINFDEEKELLKKQAVFSNGTYIDSSLIKPFIGKVMEWERKNID